MIEVTNSNSGERFSLNPSFIVRVRPSERGGAIITTSCGVASVDDSVRETYAVVMSMIKANK